MMIGAESYKVVDIINVSNLYSLWYVQDRKGLTMRKLTLHYVDYGTAIPDHMVEKEIMKCPDDGKDYTMPVSTENIIHAARVLHKEGKIQLTCIIFTENMDIINIDSNGELDHYPDGFCDCANKWLCRLLG